MKATYTVCFSMFATMLLLLTSCKKEDPNTIHVPAPPGPPTTAQVSSVQLDGGNVSGRWTMTFEQFVTFRNDTLWDFDTLTHTPGEYIMEFSGNQLQFIDTQGPDTALFSYSISGNHLTLIDGSDNIVFEYGISPQGVMRWYTTATYTSGPNVYKDYDDYLFERY